MKELCNYGIESLTLLHQTMHLGKRIMQLKNRKFYSCACAPQRLRICYPLSCQDSQGLAACTVWVKAGGPRLGPEKLVLQTCILYNKFVTQQNLVKLKNYFSCQAKSPPMQGSTQRRRTVDDKSSSFQKIGDAVRIMLCCFRDREGRR